MSKLVAVAFGEDGTTGDSSWQPDCIEYKEGQTLEDIRLPLLANTIKDLWGEVETEEELEEGLDDCCMTDFAGVWIVEEKMYNIITNTGACPGNDSAVYMMVHTMKSQLESAAIKTLLVDK